MSNNTTFSEALSYNPLLLDTPAVVRYTAETMPTFTFPDNNTPVGIEVEVERVFRSGPLAPFWMNKEDGSLRNHGREFVSIPITGPQIEAALMSLAHALQHDPEMRGHEFTSRTSVHVHVNVRDMNQESLCCLLLAYLAVEPLLYQFVGKQRHKNIFCVPINQTRMYRNIAVAIKSVESKEGDWAVLHMTNEWSKYTGLNLQPVGNANQGTVEFRHMSGTMDVTKLMVWISLIMKLKQYAVNTPYQQVKEAILSLNSNSEYSSFLRQVFGDYSKYLDDFSYRTQRLMEEAVIFIKECYIPKMYIKTAFAGAKKKKTGPLYARLLKQGYIVPRKSESVVTEKAPLEWVLDVDMARAEAVGLLGRRIPLGDGPQGGRE